MTWQPDSPRPGLWMVRCARLCPFVAARIWWAQTTADPETGEPMIDYSPQLAANVSLAIPVQSMTRSPSLAAQVGLDFVPWQTVWSMVEYIESSPEQQAALANPPLSDRTPRGNRAPAFTYAPVPLWMQQRARRITQAEYKAELLWLEWCRANNPTHPGYTYKKSLDRSAVPVPRFGVVT